MLFSSPGPDRVLPERLDDDDNDDDDDDDGELLDELQLWRKPRKAQYGS